MKRKVQAVFFDYDGTLIDSVPEIHRGVCRVLGHCGKEPVTFDDFLRTFKAPYMDWYMTRGVSLTRDEITHIYFGDMKSDESPYFPEVRGVVERLRKHSIQIGIVSAHYPDRIRARVVDRDGLLHDHEPIIGLSHQKDQAIRQLCDVYGVPRDETIYVGDLASDVRDGRAAGVLTAGFIGPRGLRETFADHEPHFYLENRLDELFHHIEPG